MRIRILLFIIEIAICDLWSINPPGLNFEPPGLHSERLRPFTALFASKASEFGLNADPDPAFHSIADPEPASMRIRVRNPNFLCQFLSLLFCDVRKFNIFFAGAVNCAKSRQCFKKCGHSWITIISIIDFQSFV
jgi:hypothetical protein